ncbi:hypothetical protein CYMTET_9939 [Cymbomonas tetramitiformis]|uniref:Uncharacterized protein n=1 Tax=Cymbomonas tetramitiformis TaxID=36881 RepID=A0AAE0GQ41_9CHLO|nr:hypothetical protein CYMTET_9939 [Cymbomonas tetramitiformis]
MQYGVSPGQLNVGLDSIIHMSARLRGGFPPSTTTFGTADTSTRCPLVGTSRDLERTCVARSGGQHGVGAAQVWRECGHGVVRCVARGGARREQAVQCHGVDVSVGTACGWPECGARVGAVHGAVGACMARVWGHGVRALPEVGHGVVRCVAQVWHGVVRRDLSVGHGVGAVHGPSAGPGRRALLSLGMARVWDAACVGRGRGVLHGLSVGHGRGVLHCLCVGHSWGVMHGFCVGRGKGVAHGVSAARGEGGAHRLPVFGTWRGLGAWIVGGARQR